MKKYWKGLLLTLIVGIGMTMLSCSDDSDDRPDINPRIEETGETGFVSLQMMTGSDIGTKAYGDEVAGTPGEQKVDKIRLVYYDARTMIAEYAFTYDAIHSSAQDFKGGNMFDPTDAAWGGENFNYTPGLEDANQIITFIPKAEIIRSKYYKLLVLVNPDDNLITATKAKFEKKGIKDADNARAAGDSIYNATATNFENFNAIKASIGTSGNDLTPFVGKANFKDTPDYFFMSNQQGLIDVTPEKIFKTEKESYLSTNRLKAPVDRAVAKVTLRADFDKISETSNATVSDGIWKLDVTNLTTYYLRHQVAIAGGEAEVPTSPRVRLYAEDTNYDLYSWKRYTYFGTDIKDITGLNTSSPDDIKKHFNYLETTAFDDPVNVNEVGIYVSPGADDNWMNYTSEYVLENTMPADEQFEDVTTAAVLKVNYFPDESAIGTKLGDGTPYYIWNGYAFDAADLVAIRDFNPEDQTITDPEKYEMFVTLQKYLKANDTGGLNFKGKYGESFTTYPSASESAGDLQVNVDGVNYYRLLIRHFNNALEPKTMGYGRYGVVRNNWYRMTLTKLMGPGSIEIPEPTGPDDREDWNVAVEIEVLPWVVRDQDVIGNGW